jgi:two-component system LytT family response regulator
MNAPTTLKLVLVDDEAPARAKLRRFLADCEGVQVVAEAANGAEALAAVGEHVEGIDALLLDIQMPGVGGLEVAAALPPHVLVAFTTAYDEFAVRAFDLNAVDYLLKPFTRERLLACVARLRERLAPPERARQRQQLAAALHQLQPVAGHWVVPDRGALRRLALAEIECVCAADNYVELHAGARTWLDRTPLATFLAHPAVAGSFVRVHRSSAVQLAHVQAIEPLERGDASVQLTSGRRVRLSRRYRDALMASLATTLGSGPR